MTIEEYRDKHFPYYIINNFTGYTESAFYNLVRRGLVTINLNSDATIEIYCADGVIAEVFSYEMFIDLKKLIETDKNFKEWRKKNAG